MATIPPRSTPQTVLVVDDNLHNRLLVEAQLSGCGYAVLLAVSGGEALELFQREQPDLVLLDVMMSDMDGFETCRRMRALPGGADTPILFATALDDPSALDAAADAGGDDYLTKPINREELVLRVRSLLRIRRLGRELQRSYDALSSLERQKAELSQFVVHDLKNPLAAILANAQFALTTEVPEDVREALGDIASSVESMNAMLLNLLDIGRGEGGDLQLHPELLRLDVLVGEAHHAIRARAGERGLRLEMEMQPVSLVADRHLLRRVIDNLLDNTLKYAPPNSSVHVELGPESEDWATLSIRDHGDGIPDEFKTKVFDRFVRLDTRAALHGRLSRGLGLAFCKLAVEAHAGAIWIEDALPQGTVFRVRLPVGDPSDE